MNVLPRPSCDIVPEHNVMLSTGCGYLGVSGHWPKPIGIISSVAQLAILNEHIVVATMKVDSISPCTPCNNAAKSDVTTASKLLWPPRHRFREPACYSRERPHRIPLCVHVNVNVLGRGVLCASTVTAFWDATPKAVV